MKFNPKNHEWLFVAALGVTLPSWFAHANAPILLGVILLPVTLLILAALSPHPPTTLLDRFGLEERSAALAARNTQRLVVSEVDIEMALLHLQSFDHAAATSVHWERQGLLETLRTEFHEPVQVGKSIWVAPGVLAVVEPFGMDLSSEVMADENLLQLCLVIRSCCTDSSRLTTV